MGTKKVRLGAEVTPSTPKFTPLHGTRPPFRTALPTTGANLTRSEDTDWHLDGSVPLGASVMYTGESAFFTKVLTAGYVRVRPVRPFFRVGAVAASAARTIPVPGLAVQVALDSIA